MQSGGNPFLTTVGWTYPEQQRQLLGDADRRRQVCCYVGLFGYSELNPKFLALPLVGAPY